MNQDIRLDKSGDLGFVVAIEHALRSDLSAKAKGYYLVLCALCEKQKHVSRKEILESSSDGDKSLRSGLKELREKGYLSREYIRDNSGRIVASELVFSKNALLGFPKTQDIEKPALNTETPKRDYSAFPPPTHDKFRQQWNQNQKTLQWPLNECSDMNYSHTESFPS